MSKQSVELPLARDIMVRNVTTFPASMPLDSAWRKLEKAPFTGVPVVDDAGSVVGILSESDVLHGLAMAAWNDVPVGRVADAMQHPVVSASGDDDVFALVQRMREQHIRRLPVCEGGELVGILTVKDLDRALLGVLAARDALIEDRKPAGAAWDPNASRARDRTR